MKDCVLAAAKEPFVKLFEKRKDNKDKMWHDWFQQGFSCFHLIMLQYSMIIVAAFQHAWNIYFWDLLGYFLDTMTLIGWRSDCYILVGVSSIRPEIRCISSAADSCGSDLGSQVLPSKLPDRRGLANGALKGEYDIEHTHELIMHLWRINMILASESIVPISKCDIIWQVFQGPFWFWMILSHGW